METIFTFKEQIGKRGYYAELSIRVEKKRSINNYPQIIFNGLNKENEEWISAFRFGADLFLEKHWKETSDILVIIDYFFWYPRDTTMMVTAFVMYNALCQIYDIKLNKIIFDKEQECFLVTP
ncbi:MAG: hypothetical protein J7604_22325 [Sporocytophaga sp.]|uniref:hypothetical protein n=1 Tax=Sporocytophaga sp. TaxID=2231183 RepID=UPI001B2B17C5|nr:hypothetical protein [Sporocytophaga sp.]MBO9702968.1 hypothetical protein [Sporocytophaga sp.]